MTGEGDTALEATLHRRIALSGPMSVAEYMAVCLTAPKGYYMSQEPFGRGGDFITAPDISQLFGELVGAWLVDRWRADGAPAPFDLVELGPGRGTLMADILRVAQNDTSFVDACRVVLVEASGRLKATQLLKLRPLHRDVVHAEAFGERPTYLVANEFFDALPLRQFVRQDGRWHERTVGLIDGRLAFGLSPFPAALTMDAADGAVVERSPAGEAMAATIARALVAHGCGGALVIDYGYKGPAFGDTLQAVRSHRPVDPLKRPGESDLSAHVDFGALAAAAMAEGAFAHGPVDQGQFLLSLGLLERAGQLGVHAPEAVREEIEAAVNRLAGSGEGQMGALFKALAFTADDEPPTGFRVVEARSG